MKFLNKNFVKKCFKTRKANSHKGQNGRVVVVGGSEDFVGAPALAALSSLAVLRTGADLVTIIAPEKTGFIMNSFSPDLIVKKVKGDFFSEKHLMEVLVHCKKADVVLVGPGIGLNKSTQSFVKKLVSKIKQPMVIDADALKAVSGKVFSNNCIITPHLMEAEIFSGKKIFKRELAAIDIAKKHKCVVLLKGKIDIITDGKRSFFNKTGKITDGKRSFFNKTGNAGMTVGGTGDILAGVCAGILSQGGTLLEAACCGAFVNGMTGERLLKKKGYGFIASDFLEEIPITIRKF